MAERGAPWYEAFFGQDYLDVYGYQFSDARADREAAFVVDHLGLPPGAALLDLCCGPGRHVVRLAQAGYAVTGLDLSADYLARCEAAARAASVAVATVRSDMREIPFRDHFNAVVNLFSSFGYLESEAEDLKVLVAVAAALKPGGRFLVDLINREWVIANQTSDDWHAGADGTLYLEHRELDLVAGRNHVTFTVVAPNGSRRDVVGHHIRLYTLTELIALLGSAGLEFSAVYGDYDGASYTIGSRRMIVLAERSRP